MSTQAVLDFWKRAAGDEGLRKKLQTMPAANRADAIVKLGAQQGCSFTRKELDEMGAAGAFLYRTQTDTGLRQKVAAAGKLKDRAAQRAQVMRIAGEAGFRFQPEQLSQVTEFATPAANAELSDRQLDQVSGGWFLAALFNSCFGNDAQQNTFYGAMEDANAGLQRGIDGRRQQTGGFKADPETGAGCTEHDIGIGGGGLPGFP